MGQGSNRYDVDTSLGNWTNSFQIYTARGLDQGLIEAVNVGHLDPNLTLLFDLPVEIGLTRARSRNQASSLAHESRFEEEALSFHQRVRDGYLEIARQNPDRIRIIDAARSPDEIFAEVQNIVIRRLGAALVK